MRAALARIATFSLLPAPVTRYRRPVRRPPPKCRWSPSLPCPVDWAPTSGEFPGRQGPARRARGLSPFDRLSRCRERELCEPGSVARRFEQEAWMENAGVGWIAAIFIGGFAGWFASMFMKSNTGIFLNIFLGILGAAVA